MGKDVKDLLLQYRDITTNLKEQLKVTRSANIVSDYGEYVVCKKLKLNRMKPGNKGYDAIDKKTGLKYEIKARKAWPWNEPTKIQITKNQMQNLVLRKSADFIIYIEFKDNWDIKYILKIPSNAQELKDRKSGSISITKEMKEKYDILK